MLMDSNHESHQKFKDFEEDQVFEDCYNIKKYWLHFGMDEFKCQMKATEQVQDIDLTI